MGSITVNGEPLKDRLDQQKAQEIKEVLQQETAVKKTPTVSRHSGNVSGERSAPGQTVYTAGQKETEIIIKDTVFPWHIKAPFVRSGCSVYGALEYNAVSDVVKCHECGIWFKSLSHHIRAHSISAVQYKRLHGLARLSSIDSISERTRHKDFFKPYNPRTGRTLSPERLLSLRSIPHGRREGLQKSPELRNLAGKCQAQITKKLLDLNTRLGRTPTKKEINAFISTKSLEFLFGMKTKQILMSLHMKPNPIGVGLRVAGHGTMTYRQKHKCGCEQCTSAHLEYNRKCRVRWSLRNPANHG